MDTLRIAEDKEFCFCNSGIKKMAAPFPNGASCSSQRFLPGIDTGLRPDWSCCLFQSAPWHFFYSGIKMGGLNLSVMRILEATAQIMDHKRHLYKSPQRIMVRIFKLVTAAEVKKTKFLRRSQIHSQATSHKHGFVYSILNHYFACTGEETNMNGIK